MRRAFFVLMLCAVLATGCGRPVSVSMRSYTAIRVAAAADLQFALPEIAVAFEQAHKDVKVSPTFGSSGNLYAQIENGAEFDLFLSADEALVAKLLAEHRAIAGTELQYAQGTLVVWVPKSSLLDFTQSGLRALADPSVRKLAIANPAHAPYGAAAEAALRQSGVYEAVKDRLVLGENIAQAAQFAESGAADAGLIAASLARAPKMAEAGRAWPVPAELYPPLRQAGAVLTNARDPKLAQAFRDFLLSPAAREIFERHGLTLPPAR